MTQQELDQTTAEILEVWEASRHSPQDMKEYIWKKVSDPHDRVVVLAVILYEINEELKRRGEAV